VYTDLLDPLFVTHAGDGSGRMFIVGRWGTIWVAGGTLAAPETYLDITEIVRGNYGEQGLLGLAFAPDYAVSGRFYVYTPTRRRANSSRDSTLTTRTALIRAANALTVRPRSKPQRRDVAFGPDGYSTSGPATRGRGTRTTTARLLSPLSKICASRQRGGGIHDPPENPSSAIRRPAWICLGYAQSVALLRSSDWRSVHR
jgi:hypothetical protein